MLRLLAILLVAATFSGLVAAQASNSPCSATCPLADGLGFALGEHNESIDPIFCSYPAVEGEDPNDFFCTYNKNSGTLNVDNDAGLCAQTAPCPSQRRRRREVSEAAVRRSPDRRASNPEMMKKRNLKRES